MRKPLPHSLMADDIYIVGGGGSLKGFDFSRLDGKTKIGANNAAFMANCQHLVSIDNRYINATASAFPDFKGTVHLAYSGTPQFPISPNVIVYERVRPGDDYDLTNNRQLFGQSSGFAAFVIAARMKPKRIHLLGIDMKPNGWWHGGFPGGRQFTNTMLAWALEFDKLKEKLENIEVFNYSLESTVTAYEKRPLGDL